MSESSDELQTTLPAPASDEASTGSGAERRGVPRYPLSAAAEVVDLKSKARVTGRSSDLSVGGCYVDSISPFAVGSSVSVRLEHNQRKFETDAVVTYSHSSMGMGISFTGTTAEHRAVLQAWIAELSGEPVPGPETAPVPQPPAIIPEEETDDTLDTISKVRQVMNEFINLMIRKKVITEKEGAGLLRQLFQ